MGKSLSTILFTTFLSILSLNANAQSVIEDIVKVICDCVGDSRDTSKLNTCMSTLKENIGSYEPGLKEYYKITSLDDVDALKFSHELTLALLNTCENVIELTGMTLPDGKVESILEIPPGQVGLLYNKRKKTLRLDTTYKAGTHLIRFEDSLVFLNSWEKTAREQFEVMDSEAFLMDIEIALRYRVNIDSLGKIYRAFGEYYQERFIVPEVRAATRRVIGRYTSAQLFEMGYSDVSDEIQKEFEITPGASWFITNSFLLFPFEFPHIIKVFIDGGVIDEYNVLKDGDLEQKKKVIKRLFDQKTRASYSLINYFWSPDPSDELNIYILNLMLDDD